VPFFSKTQHPKAACSAAYGDCGALVTDEEPIQVRMGHHEIEGGGNVM
jgi:hypothetical protein